ncbi:hypothetical protein Micbo1qcDRAFT_169409 [Microdochium bolleyi]|uniref:Ankyrin repeat-containing domain protein n=1 Tax=Microdochium bolleyi TaxID=196109 RepID=A0A136ILG8_9PEZI|nr:hypothetical protein Micbo1qcDRAFT_169409 [Microdochium bolleyi]
MALGVAHLVERDEHSGPVYFDLLEQVDATMAFHHQKLHWNSKDEYLPTTIRDHAGTVALADHGIDTRRKARMHWSNFHSNEECIHPRNWADSFVSLAVQFGLRDYVSHALDALMARSPLQRSLASLKSSAKVKTGRPLLMYALAPHVPLATLAPHDLVTVPVVELLLDKGLCINEKFEGRTCWQAALAWVYDMFVTKGGHPISAAGGTNRDVKAVAETRAEICLLLLKRGADVNVMVEVNDTRTLWRSLMTDSEESEKEKRHITVTVALRKSFTQWVSEGMRTRLLATIKEIEERSEAEERKKGKKVFTWKK